MEKIKNKTNIKKKLIKKLRVEDEILGNKLTIFI
jgi:hypothetical protein